MATQAERRASTRRALLDAAAEVLVDDGTAGFTTPAVTTRAGMSNGALFGHFPSRLDLLAATVEHVLVRLRDDYDRTFAALERTPEPSTALELLWSAMSDDQFAAVLELYTQARTDDELLAAIHPVIAEHGEYVRGLVDRVAHALGGDDDATRRHLAEIGGLAILAMQGVVVGRMAGAAIGAERDLLDVCTRLAGREIRS